MEGKNTFHIKYEKIKYKKIKDKILLVDMNQSLPTF